MIQWSKIDDKLTIYKENKVILFGASRTGWDVKRVLEAEGCKVTHFCDNNSQKWGTTVEGLPVISPEQLPELCDMNTVVQIACAAPSIGEQLRNLGITSYISYEEYTVRMKLLYRYKMTSQGFWSDEFIKNITREEYILSRGKMSVDIFDYANAAERLGTEETVIVCCPPKTGDFTLLYSMFSPFSIQCIHSWHSLENIPLEIRDWLEPRKKKYVIGVREVIAQNLSCFFEGGDWCMWKIPEYWFDGGDVQALYDGWLLHHFGSEYVRSAAKNVPSDFSEWDYWCQYNNKTRFLIQPFFEDSFKKYNGIDVFDYPFDKEKGYSILEIPEKNTEIFIYQLEKLNDVAPELGKFVGIENFTLVNGNVAENKWYAAAYHQAKKELKFSRTYFDACFNSKIMNHFYSETDIEKFKTRWISHVED